jgi:hypothetical protein
MYLLVWRQIGGSPVFMSEPCHLRWACQSTLSMMCPAQAQYSWAVWNGLPEIDLFNEAAFVTIRSGHDHKGAVFNLARLPVDRKNVLHANTYIAQR